MRTLCFVTMCVLCFSSALAQSFVVSGGRSIVASGHTAEPKPAELPKKPPDLFPLLEDDSTQLELREIRTQLASLASAVEEIRAARTGGAYGKNPELIIHPEKPRQTIVAQDVMTRYLVTAPYCALCPAAKTRFQAKGYPESNVISIAEAKRRFGITVTGVPFEFEAPVVQSEPQLAERIIQPQNQSGRYTTYQGRTYDWENETYGKCSMRSCPMCNYLYNACWSYRNSRGLSQVDDPQGPTPGDAIEEALDILDLNPNSVLAELGCGDGRVIVRAIQRCIKEHGSPCRAIGVEIDPAKVAEARRMILDHGLSSQVTILQGDVREFSPARHSVTHIYAYLYPELLQEISGTLESVGTVVCPGHECTGIGMKLIGQCWVRKAAKESYQLTSQPIVRVQQSGCSGGNCSRPQNRRRGLFR